jgi:nucleotide-binding universal stress UspA family protein
MYKNILIATDGSEFANYAVKHGLKLAKTIGCPVTLVAVTELWSALDMAHKTKAGNTNPIAEYEDSVAKAVDKILSSAETLSIKQAVPCKTVHVKDMHPAEGIISTADAKKCDLIVMASHGRRGIQKVLLGSITSEVLTHSHLPVLVVRPK